MPVLLLEIMIGAAYQFVKQTFIVCDFGFTFVAAQTLNGHKGSTDCVAQNGCWRQPKEWSLPPSAAGSIHPLSCDKSGCCGVQLRLPLREMTGSSTSQPVRRLISLRRYAPSGTPSTSIWGRSCISPVSVQMT